MNDDLMDKVALFEQEIHALNIGQWLKIIQYLNQ